MGASQSTPPDIQTSGNVSSLPKENDGFEPPSFEADMTTFDTEISPEGQEAAPPGEAPPKPVKIMSFQEKLYYKCTREPLVPIGTAVTIYALVSGIRSFTELDNRRSNKMMQLRVVGQAFTIGAVVFYVGLDNFKYPGAVYFTMQQQKQEEERRKALEYEEYVKKHQPPRKE